MTCSRKEKKRKKYFSRTNSRAQLFSFLSCVYAGIQATHIHNHLRRGFIFKQNSINKENIEKKNSNFKVNLVKIQDKKSSV
jgi:hypothetical protein